MRVSILFLAILLIGCGPTKEIRRSNRAAKKLDKLVQKYPELKIQDTVNAIVIYNQPEIQIDTIFNFTIDTTYIDSGTAVITVLPPAHLEYREEGVTMKLERVDSGKSWRYKLTAEIDPQIIEIEVKVPVDVIQPTVYEPMPMKKWQTFAIGSGILLWILILLAIILLLVKFLKPL